MIRRRGEKVLEENFFGIMSCQEEFFLSDCVIFICVAVAEVLNRDFYVLSFIKLMEDELEERRKSSRRELFRNNEYRKELFCQIESFSFVLLQQMFRISNFTARCVLCNLWCIPNHPPQWLTTNQSAETPPAGTRFTRRCCSPGSTWRHAGGAKAPMHRIPSTWGWGKAKY